MATHQEAGGAEDGLHVLQLPNSKKVSLQVPGDLMEASTSPVPLRPWVLEYSKGVGGRLVMGMRGNSCECIVFCHEQ